MRDATTSLLAATWLALVCTSALAAEPRAEEHAAHHVDAAASSPAPQAAAKKTSAKPAAKPASHTAHDDRDAFHRKLHAAKTPEEREALMHEHMKQMHGGHDMPCDMHAEHGDAKGGMGKEDKTGPGPTAQP
jgi:hypothetical protein